MAVEDADSLAFTVEEAGRRLGLSRGLMYEAVRRGQIPSIRIGRRILVPRAALERLLQDPGTPNVGHRGQRSTV